MTDHESDADPRRFADHFFASRLFARTTATREQLRRWVLAQWPAQVTFIMALPRLVAAVTARVGRAALQGEHDEEERMKQLLRFVFPAVIDELGRGRDPYGLLHHDLFALQARAFTGLTPQEIRTTWTCGPATQRLLLEVEAAMQDVDDGLHMMYVFESLAPGFFAYHERLLLGSGLHAEAIHATLHRASEVDHADEVAQFGRFTTIDPVRVVRCVRLWRAFADELHDVTYQDGAFVAAPPAIPTAASGPVAVPRG